jgi:hypothetical protein
MQQEAVYHHHQYYPPRSNLPWIRNNISQPHPENGSIKVENGSVAKRVGGQGDMEILAGEGESTSSGIRLSYWWWGIIICLILLIVALIIWWIIAIVAPKRPRDASVRDLNARDAAVCGNLTVSGMTVLAGRSKFANANIRLLSLPPIKLSDLNIVLDGSESSIMLTNQSGSIVTVTLPSSDDNPGLVVAVYNETTNAAFHVNPLNTDTIDGSNATAVEASSAIFIAMGITPSGLANWKQIA